MTKILDKLVERYGEARYRGSYQGKKSGRKYDVFLVYDSERGFQLSAFYDLGGIERVGSYYGIRKTNGTEDDPINFLDIPNGDNRLLGTAESSVKGDRIGRSLVNLGIKELRTKGGVHVVSFTEEGFAALNNCFKNEGYVDAEVTRRKSMPRWARTTSNWMFKEYKQD